MNSLVHQSSYPIYISYSSAISGFQSENIRDVGIDCLPKTDQKETVANFNLIRLPRHRLSPNFLFCCKFPTHLKHIHLRLDTCLRRPGCSSQPRIFQLIHFIEFLGVQFFDKMQCCNGLEAFPISLVLQYASIFLHAQYLLLKQTSLNHSKKLFFVLGRFRSIHHPIISSLSFPAICEARWHLQSFYQNFNSWGYMLAVKEKRDLTSGWRVDRRAKPPQGLGAEQSTVWINPVDHSSNFNSKSPFSIRTHILKVSTFHCYVRLMVFICFGSIRISFSLPKNPRISKTTIATFLTSGSSPNKTVALWVELFDSHDPRCQ